MIYLGASPPNNFPICLSGESSTSTKKSRQLPVGSREQGAQAKGTLTIWVQSAKRLASQMQISMKKVTVSVYSIEKRETGIGSL